MSDLDLDALARLAEAQAAAHARMIELNGGVGLLGVRHPEMFEDMKAWSEATDNDHADTVLALVERVRQAEAERDAVRAALAVQETDTRQVAEKSATEALARVQFLRGGDIEQEYIDAALSPYRGVSS